MISNRNKIHKIINIQYFYGVCKISMQLQIMHHYYDGIINVTLIDIISQ